MTRHPDFIARRLDAGCMRTFNYVVRHAGLSEYSFVPRRTYSEDKTRSAQEAWCWQYLPGTSLHTSHIPIPVSIEHPMFPVLMRGHSYVMDRASGGICNLRERILERYFRATKFTCFSRTMYWAKIEHLKKTCRWERSAHGRWCDDLDHVARRLCAFSWVDGVPVDDIDVPLKKENDALALKCRVLGDRLWWAEAELVKLRAALQKMADGNLAELVSTIPPGQYFDDKVTQLCLRVSTRAPHNKSWWVNLAKRKFARAAFKKVGSFGVMSLEEARAEAQRRLAGREYVEEEKTGLESDYSKKRSGEKKSAEARAIAQALYEMGIIKPGEVS